MPEKRASAAGRHASTTVLAMLLAAGCVPTLLAQATAKEGDADAVEQAALLLPFPAEAGGEGKLTETGPPLWSETNTGQQSANLPEAPAPSPAGKSDKECVAKPCPAPKEGWYMRFSNGPRVKPLTPPEKGWLALRNVLDPFNAVTILGNAAISVGADAHGPYGPGMAGFGRYVGVSYTEDITGEFVNTFLICSLAHQDPHYHRMPHASYPHRIFHAISQVGWTQGDNERGMLNYANLVGFAIDDEVANLYVPGRQTNAQASAQRYVIGLATAPIDNFVTEFLPDVAKHIHVEVVIVQRIINQVARTGAPAE